MSRILIIAILLLYNSYSVFSQDNEEPTNSVFKIYKTQAEIDSISFGTIFWKDLVKAGKIDLPGCAGCQVTGFDLHITAYTIFKSDSCSVDPELSGNFHADSAQFPQKMIKAISKAKEGKFTFSNISAITPGGQELNLNKIVLYVYPTKDYYKKRVVTYKD